MFCLTQFALSMTLLAVPTLLAASYHLSLAVNWTEKNKAFFELLEEHSADYQWHLAPGEAPNEATRTWDALQRRILCCGLRGPEDWSRWSGVIKSTGPVPESCCFSWIVELGQRPGIPLGKCHIRDAFPEGCLKQVENVLVQTYGHSMLASGCYLLLAALAYALSRTVGRLPPPPVVEGVPIDWVRTEPREKQATDSGSKLEAIGCGPMAP